MDTLQVIDKVHSFYSDSFSQLLTITLAILAFSGIILPIIIQFIQSRSFKVEQKSLQTYITSEISIVKIELKKEIEKLFETEKESIQKQLQAEFKTINDKMLQMFSVSKGSAFMLQGNFNITANNIESAAIDFITASSMLIKGKDELNGQRALNALIEDCLSKLINVDVANIAELEEEINDLFTCLESVNENGRYSDRIKHLKSLMGKIKEKKTI